MSDDEHAASSEPPPGGESPWVVLKFGGSSVSTPERWHTIARIVQERLDEGVRPVVVCSALSGVSDTLEEVLAAAEEERDPREALERLRAQHLELASGLGFDADGIIAPYILDLEKLVTGARLIGEAPARLRARVMSAGELMSTRVGAAWLESEGYPVAWADARDLLDPEPPPAGASEARRYLSATCRYEPDRALRTQLDELRKPIVLTQGFIARDENEDTVLLGRGGSDTSAAYLAARLQAARLEIWTDVPGMFTANPKDLPNARLLRRLEYDEAQMLASMGARILHPRCLPPVRDHGIPLHVRWTNAPHVDGTVITTESTEGDPGVKAIAGRPELCLVRTRRPGRWQSVGLLADITQCFKQHGLSIDLIATSPSHISVTLDPAADPLEDSVLDPLVKDLEQFGATEVNREVASVSLVGRGMRAALHKLGPGLGPLEHADVHMVSQAASDLSLTFVVSKEHAKWLVQRFHETLLAGELAEAHFGRTWQELEQEAERRDQPRPSIRGAQDGSSGARNL